MSIRSKLTAGPVGLAATATLAIGVAGALPAQVASAESPSSPTSPSASVFDGTLFVEGTAGNDAITIGIGADPTRFAVDFGGSAPTQSFDVATFTAISVSLGAGDDRFSVDPQGQFSNHLLTVRGGRGDDVISGSRGDDLLSGGKGSDTIRGNDGNDLILGGSGNDNVDGERGADTELLGNGNDTALWLPGEGSDVIDGEAGHDTLTFIGNGANEKFALSADGSHAILTRDLGTITMDTSSVENVNLAALGGVDVVHVGDLSGTSLRSDNIDLSSAGASDGQLDSIAVDGTEHSDHVRVDAEGSTVRVRGMHTRTRISGSDTRDQLQVSTAGGNDSVAVTDEAAALIGVAVDLGADQH